jgi:hypothetical protein
MKSKSPIPSKRNKVLSEWVDINTPVAGNLYCLGWKDWMPAYDANDRSHAVLRFISENEEKMEEVIEHLTKDVALDYVHELDYISYIFGVELAPRNAPFIVPGEFVLFIGTKRVFHQVVKDEEILLVDGRVFSFLAHRSSLPNSNTTLL